MKPTVGRIVHYFGGGLGPFAAIVTKVCEDQCVTLTVFFPDNGPRETGVVPFAGTLKDPKEYWNWPPRE